MLRMVFHKDPKSSEVCLEEACHFLLVHDCPMNKKTSSNEYTFLSLIFSHLTRLNTKNTDEINV